MKHLVALILLVTATASHAGWTYPQVRYWADQQGVTEDTSGVEVSFDDGIQGGWQSAWGARPTLQQVEAVDYATALAWTKTADNPPTPQNDTEQKWADLAADFSLTLPVQKGQLVQIMTFIQGKVQESLDAGNEPQAILRLTKATQLLALWIELGERVYVIEGE